MVNKVLLTILCQSILMLSDHTYLLNMFLGTVLSTKSDSDVMFCLQSYQEFIIY